MASERLSDAPFARTCTMCGAEFVITAPEIARLRDTASRNGWKFILPVRCRDCRRAKRCEGVDLPAVATSQPIELHCLQCRAAFVFGTRDQAFYAEHGWTEPRRCPDCRRGNALRIDS